MFRISNRVRYGLMTVFAVIAFSHSLTLGLLWLWAMGIVFGYPRLQARLGILGATASTTNPSDFADRQQTLLNRKLLKSLMFNLKLAPFGQSEGYSPNGRSIRFFRPRKANLSGVNAESVTAFTWTIVPATSATALTEGTVPTGLTEVGLGYVDIYQGQRILYAKITDIATALDLFNTVSLYSKTMGLDAALDYDTVCRNGLINGVFNSNTTFAGGTDGGQFERFAGVDLTGTSSADFNTLFGLTKKNGAFTREAALGCITQLKTSKIPKIGDTYAALIAPAQKHDMRKDRDWLLTAQYEKLGGVWKDAEITLDGCRYIENDNAWVEGTTYGTEQKSTDPIPVDGLTWSAIYLGDEAFGVPKLNNTRAGSGGAEPKIIIDDKPSKADPANQYTSMVAKSYYGSAPLLAQTETGGANNAILERPRYVVLRTKSTFK